MDKILEHKISIRFVKGVEPNDLRTLYLDAGWISPEKKVPELLIDRMVKGSFLFAGAFIGNRMIGMGRVLSDGVSDAYIQDVVVLKEFRGIGLGAKIISYIVDELRTIGIEWIGLIAEPGTSSFYNRLGFEELKDYTPMLYKKK